MLTSEHYYVPEEELLPRAALRRLQRTKLAAMLRILLPANRFYERKFAGVKFDPLRDELSKLPFTTRDELERDQAEHPPYGTNLTERRQHYVRMHQTSGSGGGAPLRWLDTAESWAWWKRCWGIIYAAAGVEADARVMFPFSFGPFVGFWGAFESSVALGRLSLAAGGMTTPARLRFMIDNGVNTICCTPTYALRMVEVAHLEKIDLPAAGVRRLIVAGEPGGNIAEVRQRIEQGFNARVFDHSGMTEIGPAGFECEGAPGGMHLMESEFIAEVINPESGKTVAPGEAGELVLTNLGRWASPLIRYRTGDQVRLTAERCACGRSFARMEGGILGRIDDMIVVRGNNVFPATLESAIRAVPEVEEYRIEIVQSASLSELYIEVEPRPSADGPQTARRVGQAIQNRLSLRAQVQAVACGALPRFEMKARRIVRRQTP